MSRRVLVIAHGIRTGLDDERGWMEPARDYMVGRGVPAVRIFYYGYVATAVVGIPGLSGWVTRSLVRKMQKFCKGLRQEFGPDVEIDLLAHSYGTRLWWLSMGLDSTYPKTFWRRVILMGSVVSGRVDFGDVAGHFQGLLNLRSMKDEVVALNPFGQSGQEGFQRPQTAIPPASVVQVDFTPYSHGAYVHPVIAGAVDGAWDVAEKFLNG